MIKSKDAAEKKQSTITTETTENIKQRQFHKEDVPADTRGV